MLRQRRAAAAGGPKKARIVRTAAGARRYGVNVGEAYTEGVVPQLGENGPKIKKATEGLAALGFFEDRGHQGTTDVFTPRVRDAIRLFQSREGMKVTGQLDKATQDAIAAKAPAGDPPGGHLRRGGRGSSSGSSSSGSSSGGSSAGSSSGGSSTSTRSTGSRSSGSGSTGSGGGSSTRGSGTPSRSGLSNGTGNAPAAANGGGITGHVVNPGGHVTVKKGDTLWDIAQRELGDGSRWQEIAKASGLPANFNPRDLKPGTKLTMPSDPAKPAAPKMSPQQAQKVFRGLPPAVQQRVLARARQILASGKKFS